MFATVSCIQKGSDISDPSKPTPINHTETTMRINEFRLTENVKETTIEADQY